MPVDHSRYPATWDALRAAALIAADQRCQGCGCTDMLDGTNGTKLTTHHPDRDPENPKPRLTVLCAACHLAIEGIARRRQRIEESRRDGETFAEAWRRAQLGVLTDQLELTDAV